MDKIQRCEKLIKQLRFISAFRANSMFVRNFSSVKDSNETPTNTDEQNNLSEPKIGSFADAFQQFLSYAETNDDNKEPSPCTFTSLLRNSNFMDIGDPEGKVVEGKVVHTVDDDLYIDFGWKFHCICPRPKKNSGRYVRGATVLLRVKDLELSTRFLGATTDLTILEADCILLSLIHSPIRPK